MAVANFTLAAAAATPALVPTTAAPLRVDLDDLLYSPEDHQQGYGPQQPGNEPFAAPTQQRRSKLRKRAGAAYLPPPNQYTHYPRHDDVPHNPYNGQMHTQIYQHNSRLDIQIENQRVHEVNPTQYEGQYIHDPSGDYEYEQRRLDQSGAKRPPYNPGYADAPYGPATTPNPASSRRFDGNSNQNVNNFNFVAPSVTTPLPPRRNEGAAKPGATNSGSNNQSAPDRPRGFTKVETGSSGGKTQLHAVLDYDDEDYYDDVPGPGKFYESYIIILFLQTY